MANENKIRVNVNVPEDLYIAYKKVLLEKRTNTTYDIIRHMQNTVDQSCAKTQNKKQD